MLEYGGLIDAITKLPEFAQDSPRWQVEVHDEIGQGAVVFWHGEPAQEALLIARDPAERLIYLVASPAAKQPIAQSKDRLLAAAQAILDHTQADLSAMAPPSTPNCDFLPFADASSIVGPSIDETLVTGNSFCGYGDLVAIVDGAGTLGDLDGVYGIAAGILPDDKAGEFLLWLAEGLRQALPTVPANYAERTQALQAAVRTANLGEAMTELYGLADPSWEIESVWETGPVDHTGADAIWLSKKFSAKERIIIVFVPRPVRGAIVLVSHGQSRYAYPNTWANPDTVFAPWDLSGLVVRLNNYED